MPRAATDQPRHVAIIMDGNGRWAKQHKLPRSKGHEQGGRAVERVVDLCLAHGIPWLTLYAFSMENWGRPKAEVSGLMEMLKRFLEKSLPKMQEKGVCFRAIGELELLPEKCRDILTKAINETQGNIALQLTLALSYGSRQEITAAARKLASLAASGKLSPQDITPELLADHLYTAGMPDPDLLIRTSGEMRLSNYLLWQVSYAELWVTPVLWPDFGEEDFEEALAEYATRHRRYGKR